MNSISKDAVIGKDVIFKDNCIVEENVTIGDNCYVDSNTIIRSGTIIGANAFIEANCIIGEYEMDFCIDRQKHDHKLAIGDNALIRSGSIIYTGSTIGDNFQTGHQVTIREKAQIGDHVSAGTLTDIQGNCRIGSYVRMHSNVHIGQLSQIDNFVWIYPYVVLTNDPTPPSNNFVGVHIHPFAIVATGSIVMPGLDIGQDCLIGAGAIVTKSVAPYAVAVGNPARSISDVRKTKNKITGEPAYPWREHYSNYMPWDGIGFDKWYGSLTQEQKKHFGLENIEE